MQSYVGRDLNATAVPRRHSAARRLNAPVQRTD